MSEVKVNKISPRSGTTVTLGDSGDTITLASGVSLTGFTSTGIDDNATETAIIIDSDERVKIVSGGPTQTSSTLTLKDDAASGTGAKSRLGFQDSVDTYLGELGYASGSTSDLYLNNFQNANLILSTNNTEAMRIDSSGNVLVGKTAIALATVGGELRADGQITGTRSGNPSLVLNRTTSDGEIAQFYKDATKVGSIGSFSSLPYVAGTSKGVLIGSDNLVPSTSTGAISTNAMDLGASNRVWRDVYVGNRIYLGGTGSANALNDYEEGTWTPVVIGSSTAGTVGYTVRVAKYIKVGRTVYVTAFIAYNSGTGSGELQVNGLPFVSESTGSLYHPLTIGYAHNLNFTSGYTPTAFINHNGSDKFVFHQFPAGGGNSVAIPYDSVATFMVSGTYITN